MLLGLACHFTYRKPISSVLLLSDFLLKRIVDVSKIEKQKGAGSLSRISKPALFLWSVNSFKRH